jgi:hypothetical protein
MIVEFGDFRNLTPPGLAECVITDPPYNWAVRLGDVMPTLKHPALENLKILRWRELL